MANDVTKIVADVAKAEQALRQTFLNADERREILASIFHGAYSA